MFHKMLEASLGAVLALSLHLPASAAEPVRSVLSGTMAELTNVELETAARNGGTPDELLPHEH